MSLTVRNIHLEVTRSETTELNTRYLIFFMPGNPGIVGFYSKFLIALEAKLKKNIGNEFGHIDILGISHAGFECDGASSRSKPPVDMDGQVTHAEELLHLHLSEHGRTRSSGKWKIILIGHSMGAWTAMEMLRRFRERSSESTLSASSHTYDIVGLIGLFPGITHLAQSPAVDDLKWLLRVPLALHVSSFLLKWGSIAMPTSWLSSMLRSSNDYPDDMISISCSWLRSKWGLYESLILAKEEVVRIAEDTWSDEVWGSAVTQHGSTTKLYFLWGENDHWVSNSHRDALIAKRGQSNPDGQSGGKATMMVDGTGIPHDFSIKHHDAVAATTSQWIIEVLKNNQDA